MSKGEAEPLGMRYQALLVTIIHPLYPLHNPLPNFLSYTSFQLQTQQLISFCRKLHR